MLLPTPSPRASRRRARPSRRGRRATSTAGDATSDSAGVAVLALYEEAAERLLDKKSRTSLCDRVWRRSPRGPRAGACPRSVVQVAHQRRRGHACCLESSPVGRRTSKSRSRVARTLAEAADDFASGYEVKTSVALGGAASCLADACLEERGIAWHAGPCCLALASDLAESQVCE